MSHQQSQRFIFRACTLAQALALISLTFLLSACGFFFSADTGPTPDKAHAVVRTAYSQMGKKYRLGGASPQKGFDCSGLLYWAYRQNGIKIPRVSKEQAKAGRGVPNGKARAGDIVVFRTGWNSLHTGIYAGGDTFIHSPRKGKHVKMDHMQPYWGNKLVAVRRIVN